jgi:hypothetical protein
VWRRRWNSQPLLSIIVTVALWSVPDLPVRAQSVPGAEIAVSLITVGPGSRPWEMFGHNAIRIRDAGTGTDRSYNYGLFSFEQENFVLRFMQGRMLYWMAALDTERMLQSYVGANRSIWEQRLDLPFEKRIELRDALERNALPENAYYRYDYYYDNCSTRVRDAIDRVLGGRLRIATEGEMRGATFRSHTQRLTAGAPLLYTGMQLGLGSPVDRPISVWEEMFLPLEVMEQLRRLDVPTADGETNPLVRSEEVLFESTRPPERKTPPAWLVGYLAIGLALSAVILWLAGDRGRMGRVAFAVIAGAWMVTVGVAGFALVGLSALTDHAAAYWNENLFVYSPLALPLGMLVFTGVQRMRWVGRAAVWLATLLAASSIVGLVIQILPGFDQVNGQLIALALPVNVGVALAVRRVAERAVSDARNRGMDSAPSAAVS